jgi:transcriptional regulator with GAF, ATPase, and Fis domain
MLINAMDPLIATPKTVLIVEDEFVVANDLRQILERAGYVVSGIAFTAAKALELTREQRPDLVLVDIHLKGAETGIDLARVLSKEGIPFIYVSANTNTSILEDVNSTQHYGFIVKPFREKDVLVALEIAHYRYAHSLEVRIREEQTLQIALTDALSKQAEWEKRLLNVAQLFQPYVPFDYFIIGLENAKTLNAFQSSSFLRVGQDTYKTIWAQDFFRIAGITLEQYNEIRAQVPYDGEALYTGDEFEMVCRKNPLKNLIAKTFDLRSNVRTTLLTAQNGTFYLSFFSRQPDAYQVHHLQLLERLRPSLTLTVDRLLAFDKIERLSEQLRQENNYLLEEVKTTANFEQIIGASPLLQNVFMSVDQVAPTDSTVLILGETGTGKELIARAVHNRSRRKAKTLIKVNCAALPPQLIESELFGHEKGSFTGAIEKRIGKFELASGGTIFLDEIGELPLELQPKLLRVLQEKEIERVGGKGLIPCDVRIIAATNRDLEKEVDEGRFRTDLFYRLNVFPILLPPLRERKEDLVPLTNYFLEKIAKRLGTRKIATTETSLKQLLAYHWPGNIRELEHLIERSILLSSGDTIKEFHLPFKKEGPSNASTSHKLVIKTIDEQEREYIMSVLKHCNGRIAGTGGAADLLGVPASTLTSKMKRLGIKREHTR